MNPSGHIEIGQRAPQFELPAADRNGVVSLAQYRGKFPMPLALFRGLYCPFCRCQMALLSPVADRLRAVGIETLGVVATAPERARLYFRLRPSGFPLERRPGPCHAPSVRATGDRTEEEAGAMVERAAQRLAGELGMEAPPGQGRAIVDAVDGFESTGVGRGGPPAAPDPADRPVPDRPRRRDPLVPD